MKAVARQFLILAVFFAVWYMSAIALSYAFFPQTVIPKPVDTQEADRTIYQVPSRYITMCMPNFAKSADKKIFIVGSSNAREGFRPEELEEYAPGREIFNLGMGSSNITQARDTADLVCAVFPESSIKGSVFVLGIWYGLFVTDDMRWGRKPPDLVTEETRYGLYRTSGDEVSLSVRPELLPYIVTILRPYLLLHAPMYKFYSFVEDLKTFAHNVLRERKIDLSVFRPGYPVVDQAYKDAALRRWSDYMGPRIGRLQNEQFEKLLELCRLLDRRGARLVIVDMPLPAWHRNASPFYGDYRAKVGYYMEKARRSGNVRYIDMSGIAPDEDFYDSAHPKRGRTKGWSAKLKEAIL